MIAEKTKHRQRRSQSETLWFQIVNRQQGGGAKQGRTQSGRAVATQGQCRAADDDGGGGGGRWVHDSAAALGVEVGEADGF
jgi:hypothetical protein